MYIVSVNCFQAVTAFPILARQLKKSDSLKVILVRIGNHEFLNEFRTVHNNHRQTGHKGIVIPNGAGGLVK